MFFLLPLFEQCWRQAGKARLQHDTESASGCLTWSNMRMW
jgi:hypothetical protein